MNRRGFLSGILAFGAAPAIVKAESLMKIIVPSQEIIIGPITQFLSECSDSVKNTKIQNSGISGEFCNNSVLFLDNVLVTYNGQERMGAYLDKLVLIDRLKKCNSPRIEYRPYDLIRIDENCFLHPPKQTELT